MAGDPTKGKFFKVLRTGDFGYKRMPKELREALKRTVQKHIRLVRDRIRMSFRKKKHGRIYWIRGRKHRASAPGEPPAILTGALYRSIVPKMGPKGLNARIAPNTPYARRLELGDKGGKPIAARPYMKPAFDEEREAFLDATRKTVARVLKQRAKKRREK